MPQISRPFIAISLLILVCLFIAWQAGAFGGVGPQPKAAAEPKAFVSLMQAARGDAPVDVDSVATVQAFNTALVRARIDGEIRRVAFREGAKVRAGDVLFVLDTGPLEAQRRVAQGLQSSDMAKLANARLDLARYEGLMAQGMVTAQALGGARSLVSQLQAAVESDQAQLDAARLQLGFATIRAPFDGRAGARLLDVGNMVHPGDAGGLVTVTQVQPVNISFALPQGLLGRLRVQQERAPLRVDALADDGHTVIDSGRLTLIDNQVDAATGTIRCKATFANAREQLWPGSFVTARLHFELLPQAVSVPANAIQSGNDGPFVWIVDAQHRAAVVKVRTGATNDGKTVVVDGLSGGESVVIEGQFQLEAGAAVEIKADPSAARRAGG